MSDTILVTGATGRVGGQAVRQLTAAGVRVRALTRDPARAVDLPADEVVAGDLADPASLDEALRGVSAVFLVFPTLAADHAAAALADLLGQRVEQVVYLSSNGVAETETGAGGILGSHARLESLLSEEVTRHTFLRPSGFAANTLGWADQLRHGDTLRWFHGAAVRTLIHEADIAAVGVRALTEPGHDGAAYHLTGPEQLSQIEQLRVLGDVLGRDLRFVELGPEEARHELFAGLDPELARQIVDGHEGFVRHPEQVTRTVEAVIGRPARGYGSWVRDHAADFG